MSTIVLHDFEGLGVRTVQIDGEPWFVGKDVAGALGYANETDAMGRHCKGVAKRYPLQTGGGMQEVRVLAEPDVLRLILSSNLPAAERFERWVFEDVLPSIRKTGGYQVAQRTPGEVLLAQAQAFLALEQEQAAIKAGLARVENQVEGLAESRVWDHCPQNCEPITKIRERMSQRYALPDWVVNTVVWKLPLSPKPHGMVRNQREEAKGSQYEVYAVADITRIFSDFVSECVQETPTLWSHRHIPKRFQLLPEGRKARTLKAHQQEAAPA